MSLYNSPGISRGIKNTDPHPSSVKLTSGDTLSSRKHIPMASTSCSSPSSSSFAPRPFPPPSLADVPVEYIVEQLRNLAPHYWNRPETADCTIIIPVPQHRARSPQSLDSPFTSSDSSPESSTRVPAGTGRRAEPGIHKMPRITMKLHADYLSAHSSFLRGLFSGASPLDLISTSSDEASSSPSPQRPSGPFHVPPNRLPRLLPSPPSHPAVFLPVPDPSSIHLLFHWMYFGRTEHIERALNHGVVHWEGIARNVEYLGLATEIKVFLGRWYSNWLLPASKRDGRIYYASDDEESDVDFDEEDDDEEDDCSSSSSRTDEDLVAIEEFERGRTRTIRPLTRFGCKPPQACTA
ncbi:hypothetical protein BJ138DRAFT_1142154 [Hygrophoropsis aurantiaca]|uniref:Uncharacterized protein n=1 Tax=Hygrophoropsis aurantiaca TaxID=72124 RepID=A0ACB8APU1_9AGAM|nr:hypothetical protein BJ138DRAFT_1142154 [Hygrophoropsis aurantiaca]